jgi:predicted ATPase/DNA-binding SARP family transcriptional activator
MSTKMDANDANHEGGYPPTMALRCFGPFEARLAGLPLPRLHTRKGHWLLALLTLRQGQPVEREWLAGTLWPESGQSQALANLRNCLHELRQALSSEAVRLHSPSAHTVCLDLDGASADVIAFDAAIRRGDETSLQEAVLLYRGPLLEGCAEEWILPEREAREQAYLQALETLAQHALERGDLDEAARLLRQVIAVDALREDAQRALMQALAQDGDHAAAVQVYRKLRLYLHQELNAEPDPETTALFQQIREEAHTRAQTPTPQRPTPSTRPPTTSLPVQFTRFFGREEEIARLQALLAPAAPLGPAPRLLTLTGPGGSGKTRLAIETAESLKVGLEGAAWFVGLAALTDAGLIAGAIGDALGLPRTPNLEPLEQAIGFLNGRRGPALLILDNCEHLLSEGGRLVRTLLERVPSLTCLVTSRQPLNLEGEREFPVLPLPLPSQEGRERREEPGAASSLLQNPSVALFVDRAQARRADFQVTEQNAGAVSELCRRLDGLPLAIELAAGWARTQTPREMLSQLQHRFTFLVSPRADLPERHLSLQAALEWSYRLLPAELQRFFVRLSVFQGGWTAQAAEAVCEAGASEDAEPVSGRAQAYLGQLVERSLVLAEEQGEAMRFRMLETLREFGQEKLAGSGQTERYRLRHRDCFLALAEEAAPHLFGQEELEWLERLEVEHDNLRAALGCCLVSGVGDRENTPTTPDSRGKAQDCCKAGLRLCGALWYFWALRGYLEEGHQQCRRALEQCGTASPGLCARVLNGIAFLAQFRTDLETMLQASAEGLMLSREADDAEAAAWSLSILSVALYHQENLETARSQAEESLGIAREFGLLWLTGLALHVLGCIALAQEEREGAAVRFKESLAVWRECGAVVGPAYDLRFLGRIDRVEGRREQACARFQEALSLFASRQERRGVTFCLDELALLATEGKESLRAARLYAASEAQRASVGLLQGPADSVEFKTGLRAVRAALGEEAFAAAWAEGRAMTLEQTVKYALEDRAAKGE